MNIYQENIYNHLLEHIATGKLPRNQRIPTETELGKQFGTNRMNAHCAIKKLESFGIIRRNKRQGTFVDKVPATIKLGELKSVNTRRVCVLNHNNPKVTDIHWNSDIISSFEGAIVADKIEMVFKNISHINSLETFYDYIQGIVKEGYNSLVIVTDNFISDILEEYPEVLFQFHNNVFIFDRGTSLHNWPYNVVSVNLFGEGVIAGEYLIQQGYEEIIFVKWNDEFYWQSERIRGLQFGLLRESEKTVKADILEISPRQTEPLRELIKNSDKQLAVVARNDEMAANILQDMAKFNLKVNVDFGLLGFDDNRKFRELNLTTVAPPLEAIGAKLAELVKKNIDGISDGEISTVRIASKLIIRETC